jgi:hypothetical protein
MRNIDLQVFPTVLSFGMLGNKTKNLNRRLVQDIWHDIENTTRPANRSGVNDISTSHMLERKYDSFKELAGLIREWAKPSIAKAGFHVDDISVDAFCGKVYKDPTAYSMPHSHSTQTYWTGVYYPTYGIINGEWQKEDADLDQEVPNVESLSNPHPGSIVFLDPIECIKVSSLGEAAYGSSNGRNLVDRYPNHGHPICLVPSESAITLFPTFLPHMVTPHCDRALERYAIPFYINMKYEK